MRLKRLELQGFKSFVDRTILTFEPGITGVVGPNGCGKSNIVDAIMWVMGEQSAKHLRGENMTDVIFAGSESRPPTSMAEVSLVLDRQGVPLPPQFAAFDRGEEIAVTRRIYRDGTGEFLINKSACRLRDIHELFMDTGVGRRAYSIIEQGQIDRMINVKPEERRGIFEEVAGVTKYKAKRKEAERKLEQTTLNLSRLQDIVVELEKQIRSLKVQAARAKKFREYKTELEHADLWLLGRNLFEHRRQIESLAKKRDDIVAERSQSDAQFAEMDASITEFEILRIDQEKTYEALSNRERDLMVSIQRLDGELQLLDERGKNLKSSTESATREGAEIDEQLTALETEKVTAAEEKQGFFESFELIEQETRAAEERLREEQDRRHKAHQRRDQLQSRRNQTAQRVTALETQKAQGAERESEIGEIQNRLNEELTALVLTLESIKVRIQEASDRIDASQARASAAEQEVSEVDGEVQTLSSRLSQADDALFEAREAFHGKRSRLQSLQELQENLEGYSPTAREILSKLEGTGVQALPLAECLQPEADVEDHLEALLADDMNTLIVGTTAEARELARLICERGHERVGILSLEEVEALTPPEPDRALGTPLLDRVRVKPGYEPAAKFWLANVLVTGDQEALFSGWATRTGSTWITADSRTIGRGNRVVTAGIPPTKSGVFARRREVEALVAECAEAEKALKDRETERETLFQHLKSQEDRHRELKDKLSSIHIERVELRKEKEKVQLEFTRAEQDYSSVLRNSERNQEQLESVRRQLERWAEELAVAEEERTTLETDLAEAEQAITGASTELESLQLLIQDKRIRLSTDREKLNALESRLLKIESDVIQLGRRRESIARQIAQNESESAQLVERVSQVGVERGVSKEELDTTTVELADNKAAFNETCERLQTLRDERSALQKRRDVLSDELQQTEIRLTQEQSGSERIQGLSMERYQQEAVALDDSTKLDLEKLPLFECEFWHTTPEEEQRQLLGEHVAALREKIGRYGEVNLTAIQEFDEVQKRYDFLMEQKNDLDTSIKILNDAILKIDESTQIRFTETFDAVRDKFGEIFPILFNGGKAELILVQPEGATSVLDAGVDIMVQPPGKRLQSISLLSGGEKALTAVSLVLAIFARKPSPFCLLDEVDAPLDDANVSRFNTVVRKMSEKTQFIVITHNKKTMEIAEALYGVTMERAGISKMTSVRLQ